MMWLLAGAYCFVIWLIFARLKLMRLTLPIAIAAASIGPAGILVLLFCAQYFHPIAVDVRAFQKFVPIVPQMKTAGRVSHVVVRPNVPVKQGEVLFEVDRVPFENTAARAKAAVAGAQEAVKLADAGVESANAAFARAQTDLQLANVERERYRKLAAENATTQQAIDKAEAQYAQASAALLQATSGQTQAQLSVKLAQAQLNEAEAAQDDAEYDLAQTIITAPSDGFVTNLQLQPGMLVGGGGATAVMTFIHESTDEERGIVTGLFPQKNFLLIKPDQYAEVVLDAFPGEIFMGRVVTIIEASGAGQLSASGELPVDFGARSPAQFAVRIQLDRRDELQLPPGLHGQAAVYTDRVPIAGIPVMFLLRAESWMNYVF